MEEKQTIESGGRERRDDLQMIILGRKKNVEEGKRFPVLTIYRSVF